MILLRHKISVRSLVASFTLGVFVLIFVPDQFLQQMHSHAHHKCSEKGTLFHPWTPDCVALGKYSITALIPTFFIVFLQCPEHSFYKHKKTQPHQAGTGGRIRNKAPPQIGIYSN